MMHFLVILFLCVSRRRAASGWRTRVSRPAGRAAAQGKARATVAGAAVVQGERGRGPRGNHPAGRQVAGALGPAARRPRAPHQGALL